MARDVAALGSSLKSTLSPFIARHKQLGWAFADQALISGANFVAGILLARFLGLKDYGYFALIYSILLYVNGIQYSIVLAPMMSRAPQMPDLSDRARYLEKALAFQLLLSILLAGCVCLGLLALSRFYMTVDIISVCLPFSISVLLFQLVDWYRRSFLVGGHGRPLFLTDAIAYLGQIVLVIALQLSGHLSLGGVYWAFAASYAGALVSAALCSRLMPSFSGLGVTFREFWQVGRHLFMATQYQWVASQGMLLLAAYILGAQSAGGIRASINIVGPINIMFQVMENVIPIRAATAYAQSGLTGLKSYLNRTTIVGGIALGSFLLVLSLSAREAMSMAYGAAYAPFALLVVWQCLYIFLGFFFRQATFYLRTVDLTSAIARATLLAGLASLLLAACITHEFHEVGVMFALVAGQAISLAFLTVAILMHQKKEIHD